MADNSLQSTTQEFLDIHDITNDLVIMKDGTTSLILSVDAMNFGLLAEEEQDSIIYAYAGLLNSLNYPIQVLVKSQTKDVTSYLRLLEEQEQQANTPENRQRIRRYREFVSNLIHERNVLDKKFYVVIPASPLELGLLTADSVIPGRQTFDVNSVERSVLLEKAKNILEPKRDHLISQFARIGLNSRQLTTQEIIQYFYISYNPEAAEGQEIADSNSYSTPLVKASFEGFAMQQNNASVNNQQPPAVANEVSTPAAPTPEQAPVQTQTEAPIQEQFQALSPNPSSPASSAPGAVAETPAPSNTPQTPSEVLPVQQNQSAQQVQPASESDLVQPSSPAPQTAQPAASQSTTPVPVVTPPNENLPAANQPAPEIPVEGEITIQKPAVEQPAQIDADANPEALVADDTPPPIAEIK